ncbi:MAG: hypothetical protein BRD55_06745 [Bacteroidetes bacterium SW_9_63_38]|nr:MAG: hypothetical protein BRD55_06745 [Bacteroidetes bacterium SW_9_63_38]
MAHSFFLGVDLVHDDPSVEATLSILEKEQNGTGAPTQFRLGRARQHTEDTAEALADYLQGLVAERPYIGRTSIIVNRSAPGGEALVTALTDRGLDPIAAVPTGGSGTVSGETDEVAVHLGTTDAVRTLANLYRDGQFTVEDHTTEAASHLARSVQRTAEALDAADGNQDTPAAAGHSLDDLDDPNTYLTSAALAAWCGTERSFDPSQHLKETPRTEDPRAGGPEG